MFPQEKKTIIQIMSKLIRQRQNKGSHQLVAGRHGHQIDALQLSGVGQNSLGAGGQDVVARRRHLATLRKKRITHTIWKTSAGAMEERALTTEMMSFSFS